MFICKSLDPANFDTKEECLTSDLTPSLVIDREGKKTPSQPVETLKGNAHKDLGGDKGDRVVLGFTFYYRLVKVNTKLNKQINKQEKQALPFILDYLLVAYTPQNCPF